MTYLNFVFDPITLIVFGLVVALAVGWLFVWPDVRNRLDEFIYFVGLIVIPLLSGLTAAVLIPVTLPLISFFGTLYVIWKFVLKEGRYVNRYRSRG